MPPSFPIAPNMPNMARTTSVAREKTKKPETKKVASPFAPAGTGALGPKVLDQNRDAWSNALLQISQVNTPDPFTALAKIGTAGIAGYGAGKATRQKEEGTAAYRKRLADALSGTPDNATLMGLAFDPYADENSSNMALKMWERANPTPEQQLSLDNSRLQNQKLQYEIDHANDPKPINGIEFGGNLVNPQTGEVIVQGTPEAPKPNIVTLELGKNRKLQFDISDPEQRKRYNDTIVQMQQGIGQPGMDGSGTQLEIDNPTTITNALDGNATWKAAQTTAGTLNSMFNSLSDPSAISDLDFVNGVAKILDPTSVVRTEEGRQVVESQSIPAQLLGQLNKLANGESALDLNTRIAMYKLAARRGGETIAQAQQLHDFYGNMASKAGYDPKDVVFPMAQTPRSDFNFGPMQNYPQMPAASAAPQLQEAPAAPPSVALPAPQVQPPAASAPAPQAAPPPQSMPIPAPAPAPAIPQAAPVMPQRDPLDLGVKQTPPPPEFSALPPMPREFEKAIPTPLWGEIVNQAEDPGTLAEFLNAVRRDPSILKRYFPEYYGGQ